MWSMARNCDHYCVIMMFAGKVQGSIVIVVIVRAWRSTASRKSWLCIPTKRRDSRSFDSSGEHPER